MKTKQEILTELIHLDRNRDNLKRELVKIKQAENNLLFDSLSYLIGKCFKNNDVVDSWYRIVSLSYMVSNGVACRVIRCDLNQIGEIDSTHFPDTDVWQKDEITLEQFAEKLTQTCVNLLNK